MRNRRTLLALTLALPLIFSLLFTGCSSTGGVATDAEATPADIEEAKLVREATSQVARTFEVTAGPVTIVTFPEPAFPPDPEGLRESIKLMREAVSEKVGRQANKIRFVFPEMSLER